MILLADSQKPWKADIVEEDTCVKSAQPKDTTGIQEMNSTKYSGYKIGFSIFYLHGSQYNFYINRI